RRSSAIWMRWGGLLRRASSELNAQPVCSAQPPDDPQRRYCLLLVDLRLPTLAIGKDDRDFGHPGAEALQPPEDFFLERIAAAFDGGEIEPLWQAGAVAAKGAARVFGREAQQRAGIRVNGPAHQAASRRPTLRA